MRYSTRELVYVGVFGGLWGGIEVAAGSVLHAAGVPFAGAALTAVGIAIALIGRMFVGRRGAVWFIGVVTALVKMLSVGGVVFRPVAGILIESTLAEAALTAAGARRVGMVAAGILAVTWSLLHPFLTAGLLAGQPLLEVYGTLVGNGARALGLPDTAPGLVAGVLAGTHACVGAASGALAWAAAGPIARRLGARERPAGEGGAR